LDHGTFHPETLRLDASRDMKMPKGVSALLVVGLVAFAGCKKSDQAVAPDTLYNGVKVEWPRLQTEFANSDPELQKTASGAVRSIRYSLFPEALGALESLAANPKLTEAQKKLVADVTEQAKQALAKAPPAGQ
jgi:hypothetical protein